MTSGELLSKEAPYISHVLGRWVPPEEVRGNNTLIEIELSGCNVLRIMSLFDVPQISLEFSYLNAMRIWAIHIILLLEFSGHVS